MREPPTRTPDARAARLGLPGLAAQRKAERRRARAQQWKAAVEEKARARLHAQASAAAPLAHMESLHSSLASICAPEAGTPKIAPISSQAPKHKGALRAKARTRVLAEERARFAAVMRHPVFQRDPSAAVHGHLAQALQQERGESA